MFGKGKSAAKQEVRKFRTVGIPRALVYYLYPALWETFLRELGLTVVVSSPTSRKTVEHAGLISETEHCLPVKLSDAHLAELSGKVDAVFVPRILSTLRGHIACPKLGALPDCARAQFSDDFNVISVEINEARIPLEASMAELGKRLCAKVTDIQRAAERALSAMRTAQTESKPLIRPAGALYFLVIGHPYNLHDAFLSGPVFQKLETLGVCAEPVSFSCREAVPEPVKWDTCSIIYDRLRRLDPQEWHGVIHLSSFNCGCDSIVSTLYHDVLREKKIPLMTLVLDEHAGQAGVDTRLEAFVDSIKEQHEHAATRH
ncbi:MAG: acyl-CoA dehydratase activase-related protein [Pontiellaceae bacterium]|jgi:predicted nucleotide-binding protein (sugar kinase/HSP70/actin superfamily)|nr:acyl-CoA dehydratase activase-related protein [Pontiellaceae bacterium]